MNGVSIVPIFATPFAVLSLPAMEWSNAAVAGILRARVSTQGETGLSISPYHYRSRDDMQVDAPEVQRACAGMLHGIRGVVAALNNFDERELRGLAAQTAMSFTIVRPNGSVPVHNFPLTSWCGVYCVEAPSTTERRDSGVLRLFESRARNMFSDATNSAMAVPYAAGHYAWLPVPGQMAVFPGSTSQGIAMLRSTGDLLLLTLRVRFVGPGQTGWSGW